MSGRGTLAVSLEARLPLGFHPMYPAGLQGSSPVVGGRGREDGVAPDPSPPQLRLENEWRMGEEMNPSITGWGSRGFLTGCCGRTELLPGKVERPLCFCLCLSLHVSLCLCFSLSLCLCLCLSPIPSSALELKTSPSTSQDSSDLRPTGQGAFAAYW